MLAMATVAHDADLIPGLTARDEGTVQDFVDRYWTRAYRVAYQLTGDAAGAEDVAQDAMLGALNGVGRLQEGDPFRAWFFRILENTAKKHHRSRYRREAREEHGVRAERTADPVADAERAEERALVREHLTRLSPKLRHTLALRYLEGLSLEGVAQALGIPRKTVSSRVRLGLKSLQESLQPHMACSSAILPALLVDAMSIDAPPAPALGALTGAAAPSLDLVPERAELLAASARAPLVGGALLTLLLLAGLVLWGLGPNQPPPQVAKTPPAEQPPTPEAQDPPQPDVRPDSPAPVDSLSPPPEALPADPAPRDTAPIDEPLVEANTAPAAAPAPGTIRIEGRVTLGQQPLADAQLTLWNVDEPVVSGPDGRFALDYVPGPRHFFGHHGLRLREEGKSGYHYGILEARMRVFDGDGAALAHEEDGEYWDLPPGIRALRLEVEVPAAPLTVRVLDATTDVPLGGATITAGALAVGATADGGGRATFPFPFSADPDSPLSRTGGFLRVEAPGYGTAFALVYDAQQFQSELTIRLDPGRAVSGQVVEEDGSPVAGVTVSAHEWVPEGGDMRGSSWAPMPTARTQTAADGSFTLRDLGPDTSLHLSVTGDPRFHDLTWGRQVPGTKPLRLVLQRSFDHQRAECRVVDRAGRPLSHAVFASLGHEGGASLRWARRYMTVHGGPRVEVEDLLRSGHTADASGRLRLEGADAGCAALVTAAGYADRLLAPGQARGDVTLEPECPTAGRLQDAQGQALGGWVVVAYPAGTLATVRAQPLAATDPLGPARRAPTPAEVVQLVGDRAPVRAAIRTEDDGSFALPGLSAGRYDLLCRPLPPILRKGPPAFVLEAVAAGALGELKAPAPPGVRVRLQPQTDDGAPLEQVTLVLRQAGVSAHVFGEREGDARTLELARPGPATLVVLAPGRAPAARELQGAPGLTDLGAVRLAPSAGSLTLELADLEPQRGLLVGAYVTCRATGLSVQQVVADGRAVCDQLGPGPHTVQGYVRAAAGGEVRLFPPQVAEAGAVVRLTIPADLETLPRVE